MKKLHESVALILLGLASSALYAEKWQDGSAKN